MKLLLQPHLIKLEMYIKISASSYGELGYHMVVGAMVLESTIFAIVFVSTALKSGLNKEKT